MTTSPISPGSQHRRQDPKLRSISPSIASTSPPPLQAAHSLPPIISPMEKSQLSVYADFYENYPLGAGGKGGGSQNGSPSPTTHRTNNAVTDSPASPKSPEMEDIPEKSTAKPSSQFPLLLESSSSDYNINMVGVCLSNLMRHH